MSIWNRVQYPENKKTTSLCMKTLVLIVGCGVPSLAISSTMRLLF